MWHVRSMQHSLLMIMGSYAAVCRVCVNYCQPACVSPVCILRLGQRGDQRLSSGSFSPSWASGLWAAGPTPPCLWLINKKTREFPVSAPGNALPASLLVNHFSLFYFTFYHFWISKPSWIGEKWYCWELEKNREKKALTLKRLEKLFLSRR